MTSKTATQPANRGTVTISHKDLAQLLLPVLPHVAQDRYSMVPVLEAVRLTTVGGYLTATATDRYTAAKTRHPVPEGTEFHALVTARQLKGLLAMFKPARGQVGELTLTVTERGDLQVEGPSALFAGASIHYDVLDAEYPKVDTIFAANLGRTEVEQARTVALNAAFMAKFQLAARDGLPIEVSAGAAHQPVVVTSGDHFVGIIMPVRSSGDPTSVDWSTVLPPVVKSVVTE